MDVYVGDFLISDDKNLIDLERVYELLSNTYWANSRTKDTVKTSVEHSLCYGIYKDQYMIGFARCVTDHAVMYWLGDVVIDEKYRGQGLGKALVNFIIGQEELLPLIGILSTKDAHGLYEKYGFRLNKETAMVKIPNKAL